MQTRSATYNTLMSAENHWFEVRLHITDPSVPGDAGIYYGMDKMLSLSTFSQAWEVEPTIGGVCSATIDMELLTTGSDIPKMACVVPQYRVTNGATNSEWIQKGVYYIDTRKVTKNPGGINIFTGNGYDGMMLANKPWTGTISDTDVNVINQICSIMGVTQDSRNAALLDKGYTISLTSTDATCRDILSYIAVMYGGNWIMNDVGELRFLPIDGGWRLVNNSKVWDTLTIGTKATDLNVSKTRDKYTRVVLNVLDDNGNDGSYISGTSDTSVMEAYCPWATQAICDSVYNTIKNWRYSPFDSNGVWSDPALEIGDQVVINNTTLTCYTREIVFNKGISMNLSAPFDEYVDHEITFESPSVRRYRNTVAGIRSTIDVTANGINLQVQKINELNGRNLVMNTGNRMKSGYSGSDRTTGYRYFSNFGRGLFYGDTTTNMTVSFDYKVEYTGSDTWPSSALVCTQINGTIGNLTAVHVNANSEGHFSQTVTLKSSQATYAGPDPPDDTRWRVRGRMYCPTSSGDSIPTGAVLYVTNLMVQYGVVESAWSPAPEDLTSASIVSQINISPDDITIAANRINLNGAVTANNNVVIDTNGYITAVGANLSGTFTMTGGSINIDTSTETDSLIQLNSGTTSVAVAPGEINMDSSRHRMHLRGYMGVISLTRVVSGSEYTTFSVSDTGTLRLGGSGGSTSATDPGVINVVDGSDKSVIMLDSAGGAQGIGGMPLTHTIGMVIGDGSSSYWRAKLSADGLSFYDTSGSETASYPATGISTVSEGVATSGTLKAYEMSKTGTYLLTIGRYANVDTTHDGVWLVMVNTPSSGNRSHITPIMVGASAPTPTVVLNSNNHTMLQVTTNTSYQRITITKLS